MLEQILKKDPSGIESITSPADTGDLHDKMRLVEYYGLTPLQLMVSDYFDKECGANTSPEPVDHGDTTRLLIKYKADIYVKDKNDNTLLHLAAKCTYHLVMQFLVDNLDINLFLKNKDGKNALDVAKACKNTKVVRILEIKCMQNN